MSKKSIQIKGSKIKLIRNQPSGDYICLSDISKAHGNDNRLIPSWLRRRQTIRFLGIWESINNLDFQKQEYDKILYQSRSNEYELTIKDWIQNTNCLLYTSPSPRDRTRSRMPSSA